MTINGVAGKNEYAITIKDEDIKPEFRAQIKENSQDSLYANFNIWKNNIHSAADKKADEAVKNYVDPYYNPTDGAYKKAAEEMYDHTYRENAFGEENIFDLSEGKKLTSEKEILNLFEKAATGYLNAYDTDKNGNISLEEYTEGKITEYNKNCTNEADKISITDSKVKETITNSYNFFDINGDENIDLNELKAYYATLDSLDDESKSNQIDGKITYYSVYQIDKASKENVEMSDTASKFQSKIKTVYNKYIA